MKKQQLYKLSLVVAIAIMAFGCVPQGDRKIEPEKPPQVNNTVISSEITLAELTSSEVSRLTLKSTEKAYKSGDSIEFTVNTMNKAGYLYIIYLDNKGDTLILYPNDKAPLLELSGEYTFPKDFGNITITASKDCGGCAEDKTTIYALLTKEPVKDIKNITKGHLVNFSGEKTTKTSSKSLSMSLSVNTTSHSNINFGKIEFLVK
jgi:hypothetical protein